MIKIPLGGFLQAAAGPLARKVLAGLGMGLISYGAVSYGVSQLLAIAQSSFSGLGGYIAGFAGVAGLGQALGMVAGALTARAAIAALPKLGVLPS